VTWDGVPPLPTAAGADGAATRPDLVGTDPTALRFGVSWAPFPVRSVNWMATRGGVEEIDVQMSAGDVDISGRVRLWRGEQPDEFDNATVPNATSPVTVGGRPAVLAEERFDWGPNRWVTWHPAPGLTAQAGLVASGFTSEDGSEPSARPSAVDVADLTAFADAVRLDTTTACSVPFRVPRAPAGGRLVSCGGSVAADAPGADMRSGGLQVSYGDRLIELRYQTRAQEPSGPASVPGTPDPSDPGTPDPSRLDTPDPSYTETPDPSYTETPDPSGTTDAPGRADTTRTPEPGATDGSTPRPVVSLRDVIQFNTRPLGPDLVVMVGMPLRGAGPDDPIATAVLEGITRAGDPTDPTTWPRRPF
ncbi:hypothetical protein AB0H87_41955, partial [Asanoa sp. NPDC050611]